jgi:hypothetical protein
MVENANPVPQGPTPNGPPQNDGRLEHPAVRFEATDVRFRGVLLVMLAALGIAALEFYCVWQFFYHYDRHESAIKQSPYPLAPAPSTQLPANPRLEQVDRMAKIETPNVFLREQNSEKVLNSTGKTADPGFVHIPIERAMKMVVEDLPARKSAGFGPVKDNGLVDAGEPNSGRMFREGER